MLVSPYRLVVYASVLLSFQCQAHAHCETREDCILQAFEILQSAGLSDEFCHVGSDEFDPYFPKCSKRAMVSKEKRHRRRLDAPEDELRRKRRATYIWSGLAATACVLVAALSSGLTFGLLALDPLLLSIKARAGSTEREREQAAALLPLVKQHHLLLVTLLLMTAIAGEALPMFLDGLVTDVTAVVLSVVLVVFVGQILPSAVCVGPRHLEMAFRLAPAVWFFMWILFPIAYPISLLLDALLTNEDGQVSLYNRGELSALIRLQYEEQRLAAMRKRKTDRQESISTLSDDVSATQVNQNSARTLRAAYRKSSSMHLDEVTIATSALQMKTKVAMDIFLSYRKVFAIPYDMILDESNIVKVYSSGYSRVPVYEGMEKTRIKGILLTRQLIVVNTDDQIPVSKLPLHVPLCVGPDIDLVDLINLFQTGGRASRVGHLALVCAKPDIGNTALENDDAVPAEAGLMGIVTLEDALECLIQEQIYDEMDAAGRMPAVAEMSSDEINPYRLV